jgi:hypothetical protein
MLDTEWDAFGASTSGKPWNTTSVVRSPDLRDRLSPKDHQVMIDLYRSGATARQVAEKFGVSLPT